jgi:hypothetical protein
LWYCSKVENVKILATPEAYEMLTSSSCGESVHKAVCSSIEIALTKLRKTPDHFIEDCPLALSAYWATSPNEDSIILIYKQDSVSAYYCINYNEFFSLAETALPISLV